MKDGWTRRRQSLHTLKTSSCILANSDLLETKLTEESHRVRAAQVVTGALEAIAVVPHLKQPSYHSGLTELATDTDDKPTLLQVPPII